jgi:hypothetical protein
LIRVAIPDRANEQAREYGPSAHWQTFCVFTGRRNLGASTAWSHRALSRSTLSRSTLSSTAWSGARLRKRRRNDAHGHCTGHKKSPSP